MDYTSVCNNVEAYHNFTINSYMVLGQPGGGAWQKPLVTKSGTWRNWYVASESEYFYEIPLWVKCQAGAPFQQTISHREPFHSCSSHWMWSTYDSSEPALICMNKILRKESNTPMDAYFGSSPLEWHWSLSRHDVILWILQVSCHTKVTNLCSDKMQYTCSWN